MLRRAERQGRKFVNPVETLVGGLSTVAKVLPLFLKNREERVPKVKLGPFRTDARVYGNGPGREADHLRVTWMGHSSMLLEIAGVRVLVDPVWDERASPVEWAGPKRFFSAPLRLEELPRVDVVLISHDHFDHLGKGTVRRLARMQATAKAQWVTSLGVGAILRKFGVAPERVVELDWTEGVGVGGLEITALPARHFSGRGLGNRFHTLWASFVLAGAERRVYYGADSGWWEGFAEIGQEYGPFDLTMLEIGAFHPLWADIHLGPEGAIQVFRAMDAGGMMMPIHWGLFDLALHGWREPIARVFAEADLKIWAPEPGVPTEVVRGVEVRSEWWR